MHSPVIHEKVRLKDRDGLFLVIRIDAIRRVVNLLPFDGGIEVLEGDVVLEDVAFDSLEAITTARENGSRLGLHGDQQANTTKPD